MFDSYIGFLFWILGSFTNTQPTEQLDLKAHASSPVVEEVAYTDRIEDLGITLHPGTSFRDDSVAYPEVEKHCTELVYHTLTKFPAHQISQLKNLTLFYSEEGRRGYGGGDTIILRCTNVEDYELVAVLIHELGHVYDTGVLKGSERSGESNFRDGSKPVFNDDPSLEFYRISYVDDKTLKSSATALDFVSGYAMSDPFEDFAESYIFYLLHGDKFRKLAAHNETLSKKYDFLKEKVFAGKEYNFATDATDLKRRKYDTTVLAYDFEKYLAL